MRIYHLADGDTWAAARTIGLYRGRDADRADGFLHFSNARQIVESAAKHKAGVEGLVLLSVDAGSLGDALKWERSRGGALFPHLYGDLPVDAVIDAVPLPLDEAGQHIFPVMS